jgi:hypothetical protein
MDPARASSRDDLGPLDSGSVADLLRADVGDLAALGKRMEPARIASK